MQSHRLRIHSLTAILLSLALAPPLLSIENAPAGAGTQPHPFPIREVQVYSDQALVERAGDARLKRGESRLIIDDLPGSLFGDSVRAVLEYTDGKKDGLKIREIEVESVHEQRYLSEEAREAEVLLREAESHLRRLSDEYAALREEEKMLRGIQPGTVPNPKNGEAPTFTLDPRAWQQTLDFLQTSLKNNHDRTRTLLGKIDDAREELSVALFVAERYRSAKSYERKRVTIQVDSEREADVRLRLNYRIGNAAWFPVYGARVERSAGSQAKLRLIAYALVRNETGEDWDNVRMTFSAADPEESARLLSLRAWRIGAKLEEAAESERRGSLADKTNYGDVSSGASDDFASAREEADEMPVQEIANEPLAPAAQRRQESLNQQRSRSKDYYTKNFADIKEEKARKKSDTTQKLLSDFEQNISNRDRALERGDFDDALRYSENVIENIGALSPRYQKHFTDEQRRSEKIKRRSLEMQENRALIARLVPPSRSARGYDHRYVARNTEDVSSDGAFRKTYLYEKDLSADLLYEATPLKQPFAFLTGRVRYTEETPLLEGPVSVFHDRDYVGEALLKDVSKKEPFPLHLGANEDISLSRTEDKYREKSGILSTSYVYKHTVTITVKNRRRSATELDVFDRLPVSNDERVKVSDVSIEPMAAERHEKAGLLRFRLKLQPGEERKIIVRYTVSHPEGVLPSFYERGGPRW